MDQDARKIHVARFRSRKTMQLIVTDVAARGIDMPLLDNVIKPKIFVHRVGRAARAGRTGTAFSFVTSDDMPYLLDLNLFLSKPIWAALTEENVLQDMDGVMSNIDDVVANGETVYRHFPQTVLDLVLDRIRETIALSGELISLQKACTNAFRLYSKTKPSPSKESIKRAKDLSHEELHPILKNVLEGRELMVLTFSERLKAFRERDDSTSKEISETIEVHVEDNPEQKDLDSSEAAPEHEVQETVDPEAIEARWSTRERRPLAWHSEYVTESNVAYCLLTEDGEPLTFHEARNSSDASLWMTAMQE
ncbi:hypothetical protein LWI28_010155 [Acer negundo]|uniref:Helicase C-terminal domain-containing protein n=1 Tax=Acer negundo TaxID=4023 RepID=A0AAD5J576_ACENE|nr:hypothetical protein LWI28_010155 [Acer negundo]